MAAEATTVNENNMDLEEDILDNEDGTSVDLGFLEKCESWRLRSEFFPSKVGGKPSWLELSEVPTCDRVLCGSCQNPCTFLCQIYAPVEEQSDCFHRTLFVFMCPSVECCMTNNSSNFRVLRSQLKRVNDFYSSNPPIETEEWRSEVFATSLAKLCQVCNLRSNSHCGKCRTVNYCCRQHQVADWKAGHKLMCAAGNTEKAAEQKIPFLLPEWELVTEPEPLSASETKSDKSVAQRLQEFQTLVQSGQAGSLHGDSAAEAELQAMPESSEDTVFKKFKQGVARSPTQVLRYEREGQPLWVSEEGQPGSLPPCPLCGESRVFECQILPQMLNYLGLDQVGTSIDWGTLAIFTCQRSCNLGPAYKEEVIIKQDFTK